jgi:8-oxo-dGTP pyrophosphatase MutT (NUDIX family)
MIIKAALLLFRDNHGEKELLFARAKGKTYFVFPGGKQEKNETIDQALQRELQEELGTQASMVVKLGIVSGKTPEGEDLKCTYTKAGLKLTPTLNPKLKKLFG